MEDCSCLELENHWNHIFVCLSLSLFSVGFKFWVKLGWWGVKLWRWMLIISVKSCFCTSSDVFSFGEGAHTRCFTSLTWTCKSLITLLQGPLSITNFWRLWKRREPMVCKDLRFYFFVYFDSVLQSFMRHFGKWNVCRRSVFQIACTVVFPVILRRYPLDTHWVPQDFLKNQNPSRVFMLFASFCHRFPKA